MIIFVYLYSGLPERQDANLRSRAGEGILSLAVLYFGGLACSIIGIVQAC
jgi:hypothetical protein